MLVFDDYVENQSDVAEDLVDAPDAQTIRLVFFYFILQKVGFARHDVHPVLVLLDLVIPYFVLNPARALHAVPLVQQDPRILNHNLPVNSRHFDPKSAIVINPAVPNLHFQAAREVQGNAP